MPARLVPVLRNLIVRLAGAALLSALVSVPPAAAQTEQDSTSVTLQWTAPGDDGTIGRASSYDLRYSEAPVGSDTTAWWAAAASAGPLPRPLPPGTRESLTVSGLEPGKTYYFIIRAADEVPNWSGFSNVAVRQPGSVPTPTVASSTKLHGCPNPARDHVSLRLSVASPGGSGGRTRITIFDLSGHRIRTLVDGVLAEGPHAIDWNCRSDLGSRVAPGLYNVIMDGPSGRSAAYLAILP